MGGQNKRPFVFLILFTVYLQWFLLCYIKLEFLKLDVVKRSVDLWTTNEILCSYVRFVFTVKLIY